MKNYLNKILKLATQQLKNISTSASLDAEVLLSFILNKKRNWILSHLETKINIIQKLRYQHLVNKRNKGWPIAYLIKEKEFYNLKFKINKKVLIPRPESELFIEEIKKINPQKQTIVDVGTGSGCLIVSLAKNIPNNRFIGVDISKSALHLAKKNSQINQTNIKFKQSNLLKNIDEKKIDIIIANLPYLTIEQMVEPSIKREPRIALLSNNNGLGHYEKLLFQISQLQYVPSYIFLEIDPQQEAQITNLIKNTLPKKQITTIKDLNNNTRLVKIS